MEIERKFLLHSIPFNIDQYKQTEIEQAYISIDPTIRLRRCNNDYFLTIKQNGFLARDEAEFIITKKQYDYLWNKIETNVINKTRVYIPLPDGLTAEVDIYHGVLHGLKTVEVEFNNLEQAESFVPPEWFGTDVTNDLRYYNNYLASKGINGSIP